MLLAYPTIVQVCISEAALFGDYAETFNGKERHRRKISAVHRLSLWAWNPPVKLPLTLRDLARNEFFYHSGDFKSHFLLAKRRLFIAPEASMYGQGVGGSYYAAELCRRGLGQCAQCWAESGIRSLEALWQRTRDRVRWDEQCFYAVGLAALGRHDEAETALAKVKAIIGYDIRDTHIYDIKERLSWCRRKHRR